MPVFPPKPNALLEIFGREKVLIGTVHSHPLPGSPRYAGESLEETYAFAVEEARRFKEGGFHGVIVENSWDIPFSKPEDIGLETAAAMAVLAERVAEVGLPVGVNVLANGVACSLAVAKAAGGRFVRANQWVNAYVANEGYIEGPAPAATRYRSWIRADDVKVFADVHVKHGSHAIVADRPLDELTRDAEFFDADVLIATGQRTGGAAELSEINGIRDATGLPVIIGSGITLENARELLSACDGAIVASSLKEDGVWWNPVEVSRVDAMAKLADEIW
ncbi:MAG TPA: BtpA/SgcQ family protein [Gaiellaceae bacterium]|nr:BtpA/SgcQ family protein [Gaiellaceae bacterium]